MFGILGLGFLLGIAGSRIIRSAVVSVRENMYVHAAQSIGASTRYWNEGCRATPPVDTRRRARWRSSPRT